MSFFDDKQEILKVELTTYGRFLLSKGKLKPAYYAFFDDDILYDAGYAALTEEQASAQDRILDETPSLKPQTTFIGVGNSAKNSTLLFRELERLKEEESQISSDKNYSLCLPLANCALNTDYAPAWTLRLIEGKVSGNVERYLDNSAGDLETLQPYLKIPQISLETRVYDIDLKKNDDSLGQNYEPIAVFTSGSDSYHYSMVSEPILLELLEENVEDLLKKFDIELFIQEQEKILGSGATKTSWKQLKFKKEMENIVNDILLDDPIEEVSAEETEEMAEYFFELTLDNEIELPPVDLDLSGPYGRDLVNPTGPFGDNC